MSAVPDRLKPGAHCSARDQATPVSVPPLVVDALQSDDYPAWRALSESFKTFYQTSLPETVYQQTWQRLLGGDGIYGWGARVNGHLLGFTHYLYHTSIWSGEVCYLQDLFVDESARSHGVAQALIERVARSAQERGARRLYWLTHHTNQRARRLYDRVATYHGFLRYDYTMAQP